MRNSFALYPSSKFGLPYPLGFACVVNPLPRQHVPLYFDDLQARFALREMAKGTVQSYPLSGSLFQYAVTTTRLPISFPRRLIFCLATSPRTYRVGLHLSPRDLPVIL